MITNNTGISLEMAVWLVHDEYDYVDEPNYISATSLMKPLRQIILPSRVPEEQKIVPDVSDYIARSLGTSLHAAIEKAWTDGYQRSLKLLGYPRKVIDQILVNPTPEELAQAQDPIVVYLEQRRLKKLDGYTIGGKFDLVCDGILVDVKSTSAWTWVYGGKDEDYKLQGSIYRWLNPDLITSDFIRINFIFTDWQKAEAAKNPNYPQQRLQTKDIPLMSREETEAWIRWKLSQIEKYKDAPEEQIPECSDEELWLSTPKHKYYSNPAKTDGRSTRNFDDLSEARQYQAAQGKGVVITIPGVPKRCGYCMAFPICKQKDKYNVD